MAAARQLLAVELFENSNDSDSNSENENEDEGRVVSPPRQSFTIFEITERLLYQRTRLNRRVFNYVLDVITPALTKNTRKGRYAHLTPMHKLYVTLQFYATGSFQWSVGSSGRISQSAASHAINDVTKALVAVAPQFIRFPRPEDYPEVKQAFYALGIEHHGVGFPNVLGAIDCIHVRIRAPRNTPEQYLNRHNYYSINVQLIVGPDLKIFNVFAEYPGSNHDSFIWRKSAVRNGLISGKFPEGWLVGDSGYPVEPWLMIPVPNPTSEPEQLYNSVHISTRNPVERINEVLKSRWHVLDSPLAYTPDKVCSIATACCVLNNICTEYNLEVEDLQEHPLNDDFLCQETQNLDYEHVRRNLIEQHFTC